MTYVCASYAKVMNVLMVAPTRAGKGVGFVISNGLTFPGSMVVLDVKGELWEETARARVKAGDKVFRLAPFDFMEMRRASTASMDNAWHPSYTFSLFYKVPRETFHV